MRNNRSANRKLPIGAIVLEGRNESNGDLSGQEGKKEIVRREIYQGGREEIASPFKSENTDSQDSEADQKDGRFIASEGVEAWDRFRSSTITLRFPNQNSSSNHVQLRTVRDYGVCSRHVYGGERYRYAYRTIHNLG
jgi:hypothetical protein